MPNFFAHAQVWALHLCALFLAVFCVALGVAQPQHSDIESDIEEVTVIGDRQTMRELGGSAHRLSSADMQRYLYTDIHQMLRQIPGVYVRDEEGYGLRPNIGIRGSGSERSARVTLMEDGVPIAPAPYAAPSAYYFPTAGRLHSIEVFKGPAAIRHGPQTVGGIVNMLSTPFQPDSDSGGKLTLESGGESDRRLHANYGASGEHFDWLLETHQWRTGGFRSVDFAGSNTGLDKKDYLVKSRWSSSPRNGMTHSFAIRLDRADEDSDQSYMGLTENDYDQDPLRRYAMTQNDNFSSRHSSTVFRYVAAGEHLRFTLTYYDNQHERNWFKLEGVDADGSTSAGDFSRTSLSSLIAMLNAPQPDMADDAPGHMLWQTYQSIIAGEDTEAGALLMRDNSREYRSHGWDMRFRYTLVSAGDAQHQFSLGLQIHEDEEDRLQRNSTWQLQNRSMVVSDAGIWGNAGNRLSSAEAMSLFTQYQLRQKRWLLVAGARQENVEQRRRDWSAGAGRSAETQTRDRKNSFSVWLPGVSFTWFASDQIRWIAGVHKGFVPAGNSSGQDPEESWNYEFGTRAEYADMGIEAIAFYSDYENLLGTCTASSGASCEVGDQFSGKGVSVAGLELQLTGQLPTEYSMPFKIDYTYTNAEFESSFDSDFFGDVTKGDKLTYTPERQLNVQLGLEHPRGWSIFANAAYTGEMCSQTSCERLQKTDASWALNVSGAYALSERLGLYMRVDNLLDADAVVSRTPSGAFPQRPRYWLVGLNLQL